MKKVLVFIIFIVELYGIELKDITNIVNIFEIQDNKPKWVVDYKKGESLKYKDGLYFIGVSRRHNDDLNGEKSAKQEAFRDGYRQISEYFGVYIKSTLNISSGQIGRQIYHSMDMDTKTKSVALLFDIVPDKTFVEKKDDYLVVYELLKLSNNTIQKIRNKIKKDRQKYIKLKYKILEAINNKDFYKARNLLALAKSMRSSYTDNGLKLLEQRINHLKSLPNVYISLEKNNFLQNEDMVIKVSVDKNSFVYVFYGNRYLHVLLPDEETSNYLYKDNDIELYDSAKAGTIIAIASQKKLIFPMVDNQDGDYMIVKRKNIKKVIQKCLSQAYCTRMIKKVNIKKSYIDIKLILEAKPNIKIQIRKYLAKNGIILKNNSRNRLVCYISEKKEYSKSLGEYLTLYKLKVDSEVYYLNKDKLLEKIKYLILRD